MIDAPWKAVDRVVVDASALAAIAFGEPAGEVVGRRLEGAAVFAPVLLKFELANTAWKKARRHPQDSAAIFRALATALNDRWGIIWREVDIADTAFVAQALGVSAYDASYLWLAGSLGADLVTLDEPLARLSDAMAT
jgi:predicted nucleic acid-binding protein